MLGWFCNWFRGWGRDFCYCKFGINLLEGKKRLLVFWDVWNLVNRVMRLLIYFLVEFRFVR